LHLTVKINIFFALAEAFFSPSLPFPFVDNERLYDNQLIHNWALGCHQIRKNKTVYTHARTKKKGARKYLVGSTLGGNRVRFSASEIRPGYIMIAGYDVATLGHMVLARRWR
jgi:hypothetical protein